jgi:UDP-glucose 4-epimerase
VTILELADLVRRTVGSASPVVHRSYDQAYGPDFEDLRVRQPDLSRIRAAIGFAPAIPLERTVADVAAAFAGAGAPR